MHHFDFASELNLVSLGLDMSLAGHVHSNREDASLPFDILTDNASGTNRPFRLVHFANGRLSPRPTLEAGLDGQTMTVDYFPSNDGMHNQVAVTIHNGYPERFESGLIKVAMPTGVARYVVDGGVLAQVDDTADPAICHIDVDIPASGTAIVIVEVDNAAPVEGAPAASPRLLGARPNPFNPLTEIAFELDRAADCRLTIFDLHGHQVAVLVDGALDAGLHRFTWKAADAQGNPLPSGVYSAGLRAGGYAETRKLTLVR